MRRIVKIIFFALIAACNLQSANAQSAESQTVMNMLRLPMSAHISALGGDNITLVDDDASSMFSNPALLSCASNKTIGLNYMNYLAGVNLLSAHYNLCIIPRGTVGVSAQYMDYGSMLEADENGNVVGDFTAKDICFGLYFSYLLTDYLAGGITAKAISSNIAEYSAFALGVDLGLHYYNPETEWSFAFVIKNLGGEIVAYDEDYEALPLDIQLGVSKRLQNTPLRLHATLVDLNHPHYKLVRHLAFGADFLLTNSLWVGAGYNFRRGYEMEVNDSKHGAGLTLGAGLNLDKFGVNVGWAKYHSAGSSLSIGINYKL